MLNKHKKWTAGIYALPSFALYGGDGFRVVLGRANSENDRPPHHPRKVRIELP